MLLTPCLPTGHFWATSSTPLSANGPLLGHLFGSKYLDKFIVIYNIYYLNEKKNHFSTRIYWFCLLVNFMACSMLQSKILKGTVSHKICNVANVFPAISWHDVIVLTVHQLQRATSHKKQRATSRNEECTFTNTELKQNASR